MLQYRTIKKNIQIRQVRYISHVPHIIKNNVEFTRDMWNFWNDSTNI